MALVKMPHDVAEALGYLKVNCGSQGILAGVLGNANTRPFEILKKYIEPVGGFAVLLEALVNGYEVERTPEEIIKTLFVTPPFTHSKGSYQNGMVDTLNALNINIEGVNT